MLDLTPAWAWLLTVADEVPKDEDVVAGPWGALVLVLLIVGLGLLGRSLVKQLRKAQAAEDAGVYGADPSPEDDTDR